MGNLMAAPAGRRTAVVRLVLLLVLATVLLPGTLPAAAGSSASSQDAVVRVAAETTRIGGADRYEVAVNVSRHRHADPSSAETVYLARGDVFADALTAGTLEDGPVLLVRPGCRAVPQVVLDEIARVDPAAVVALGGEASVCGDQLTQAAGGRATDRLGGADRFEAAASIAGRAFSDGASTVYLANGAITPDAVVGGALRDGPILLASWDGTTVPPATAAAVAMADPDRVVALGGPVSVSDRALSAAAAGRPTERVGGADRYEVAVNVADRAYPRGTERVYVTRGDGANFADAVAAGMLADGPVLLTAGPCTAVRPSTAEELGGRTPARVVALGGPASLCDSLLAGASLAGRGPVDCATTPCVALTFDDGPSWPTPVLLDTAAAHRVPLTFFVVGQMVDAAPAHTRRAWVEGHGIGNHSWDHPQLDSLTLAQQRDQVVRTDAELREHGMPRTTLLRPPYGYLDENTRDLGLPLVLWDVNPRDWTGPSAEEIREHVVTRVRPGSIVLQHDVHINTVTAVDGIVTDLHAAGYTFVSVEEMVPGAEAGSLIYNRTNVKDPGTPASVDETIVLDDGRVLGRVVDEAGVPGLAPALEE